MTDWRADIDEALTDFETVAQLAGDPITKADITVEYLNAPHRSPTRLPAGQMAIYGFWHDGVWLKIGKAGPKSAARYTSQHYSPISAISTLARSLIGDPAMRGVAGFDPERSGDWIRANTCRVNLLLPANRSVELLSLLEAFLHLRLRPRYEGPVRSEIVE
jgi:hypothetical protein